MRVLVFHGYLLRGTGSNVYNASLAQALADLGHEVHLLCQDRLAGELGWVDSVGGAGRAGAVTVHVPDIGEILPVYVADSYDGFRAKTFAELTEAELDAYLESNVEAVRGVVGTAGDPDAALANHLVMGPAILARAGLGVRDGGPGFAVKIHGSALEYTVKPGLERFGPYAREGIAASSGVLVGSRHTAESLWATFPDADLRPRTRLGPPGVDTDLFSLIPTEDRPARLLELAAALRGEAPAAETSHPRVAGHEGPPRRAGEAEHRGGDGPTGPAANTSWGRDPRAAAEAIEWFAQAEGPRVVFVGKLIVSKGVDLLLAAWPFVVAANLGARLLLVGFGEYREGLERLWRGLGAGDLDDAREIAAHGRALEGGPPGRLEMLEAQIDAADYAYVAAAARAAESVRFAGRLEHDEVGRLVPAADALVFPSTFPEAFGMVAAEAASAGVLPVGAAHSGIAEVSRELAAALPEPAKGLVSFELGLEAVTGIAGRLNAWLGLGEDTRHESRVALRETVARLWSWAGVARGVLAAARGDLDSLPEVPPKR
jgi:glycosyltransferase involved in cell wall biosynthesis